MAPTDVVNEFIARICRMDVDAACEPVTEDVEYDNVPMGKNFGPQGIKDILGAMSGGVDDVEFIIHRQVANGETVMNERTDRFTAGGTHFDLPVMGLFEVDDDGLITLWRDYFDMGIVNEMLAHFAD